VSELAQVVAYVFRRHGRDALGRNEFKQFLAFRLNWYPPSQAAQVLERALQAGLLEAQGEDVRITFPDDAIDLPLNFRGTARALDEPLQGVPTTPPAGVAAAAPPAPRVDAALEERVRALRDLAQGRLSEPAARLLARRERGQDVRAEAAAVLQAMATAERSPEPPSLPRQP
jgi:hypothetical protein